MILDTCACACECVCVCVCVHVRVRVRVSVSIYTSHRSTNRKPLHSHHERETGFLDNGGDLHHTE